MIKQKIFLKKGVHLMLMVTLYHSKHQDDTTFSRGSLSPQLLTNDGHGSYLSSSQKTHRIPCAFYLSLRVHSCMHFLSYLEMLPENNSPNKISLTRLQMN